MVPKHKGTDAGNLDMPKKKPQTTSYKWKGKVQENTERDQSYNLYYSVSLSSVYFIISYCLSLTMPNS